MRDRGILIQIKGKNEVTTHKVVKKKMESMLKKTIIFMVI